MQGRRRQFHCLEAITYQQMTENECQWEDMPVKLTGKSSHR